MDGRTSRPQVFGTRGPDHGSRGWASRNTHGTTGGKVGKPVAMVFHMVFSCFQGKSNQQLMLKSDAVGRSH